MGNSIADLLFKLTPVENGTKDITGNSEDNTDDVQLGKDSHDGEDVPEVDPEEPDTDPSNVELLERKIDLLEKRINDLITHAPMAIDNPSNAVESDSADDADLRELDWTISRKERSDI